MSVGRIGFSLQPALHVQALGFRIVQSGIEEARRVDLALPADDDRGRRVQAAQSLGQRHRLRRRDQVGLGQQQAIGDGGLFHGLDLPVEGGVAGRGIDGRDHAIQTVGRVEGEVGHQRVQDRRRIGEPRRLDQHPVERRDGSAQLAGGQAAQRVDQVAANGAAQASALQQDHVLGGTLDQFVIEADLAELVDHDDGARELGPGQELVEDRRLAAAEKPGQQGHRHERAAGTASPIAHRDDLVLPHRPWPRHTGRRCRCTR